MDLGEHVRTHGPPVSARHCRDTEELGDATAHRGVGAEIVGVVVVEDLHEVVEAGAVLADSKRNVHGATERRQQSGESGGKRILDPREAQVDPCVAVRIADWRSRHDQCRSTISSRVVAAGIAGGLQPSGVGR